MCHMAAFHLSNDPKRALRKLSLPKGLWEWIFIGCSLGDDAFHARRPLLAVTSRRTRAQVLGLKAARRKKK